MRIEYFWYQTDDFIHWQFYCYRAYYELLEVNIHPKCLVWLFSN